MTIKTLSRLAPLIVLILASLMVVILGVDRYLSFEMLSRHHADLTAWVEAHGLLAAAVFVIGYALVVALSLPVAVLLTPLGGFLFGPWLGATLSVIAATLGAVAVFLAARSAFGGLFRARASGRFMHLEQGFARDDFSYLLFLRLVPVFPFWLVNVVPALIGMKLGRFALATLIGIIPAAIVYAGLGDGFGMLFEKGEAPNLGIVFEWRILLPLLGLGVLALVPVGYRRLRARF